MCVCVRRAAGASCVANCSQKLPLLILSSLITCERCILLACSQTCAPSSFHVRWQMRSTPLDGLKKKKKNMLSEMTSFSFFSPYSPSPFLFSFLPFSRPCLPSPAPSSSLLSIYHSRCFTFWRAPLRLCPPPILQRPPAPFSPFISLTRSRV